MMRYEDKQSEVKMTSRPWKPQDLLDDLQLMIEEEPDRYLNFKLSTLHMAKDCLERFFLAETLTDIPACNNCKFGAKGCTHRITCDNPESRKFGTSVCENELCKHWVSDMRRSND